MRGSTRQVHPANSGKTEKCDLDSSVVSEIKTFSR